MGEPLRQRVRTEWTLVLVFSGFLAVFLFCASGNVDTVDAEPSIRTAEALIDGGRFAIRAPIEDPFLYAEREPGVHFTKLGLVMPVLYLPAVALARVIDDSTARERVRNALVSFVNAFVTAGIALLLFGFFLRAGATVPVAVGLAAVACFGTLLFPYAKTSHREPMQALCLLGSVVFLSTSERRTRDFACGGAFIGLGFLTKLALLVPFLALVALGVAAVHEAPKGERATKGLAFLLPILLCGALWLVYARLAFGDWLSTGYSAAVTSFSGRRWARPFWGGLGEELFSSRRGLFVYSPLLLLGVFLFCRRAWQKRLTLVDGAALVAIALQLAFCARWQPVGEALGPRLLVPLIPLFVLPFADLPALWRRAPRWRPVAVGIIVIAVSLQGVNVAVKMQQYWTLRDAAARDRRLDPHWLVNLMLFAHKLRTSEERYRLSDLGVPSASVIDVSEHRTLVGFNFWWLHWYRLRHRPVGTPVALDNG